LCWHAPAPPWPADVARFCVKKQFKALLRLRQLQHLVCNTSAEGVINLPRLSSYVCALQQQVPGLSSLQQLSHLELGLGPNALRESDLLLLAERLPRLRHLVTTSAPPHARLSASCPKLCVRCRVDARMG